MAFGPSTPLIQQALLTLLNGRTPSPVAPVPLAPTGGIGPLEMDTTAALAALQPPSVPPALPGPVDADTIRSRFAGLAGPEPVAPTPEPTSLIIRIARALQGFGAGTQGQGPQFLAQLREERERPQREFQAKKERFDTRKQELGVMAEQEIGRAEDRRATRTQTLLDQQFEREFNEGARRLKLQDQKELDLFRDTLLAKREREADERQAEENRRKEAQATKIKLAELTSKYRAAGAKGFASELAQKDLDPNFKLSPGAEKWFSARVALDEARANRIASGGTGGGGSGTNEKAQRAAAEIQSIKDKMIEAEARGDQQTVKQLHTRVKAVIRMAARFPEIEAGFDQSGKWPYVKIRGTQGSTAPGTVTPGAQPLAQSGGIMATPPPDTVKAYMERFGITDRNQAIRELMGQ